MRRIIIFYGPTSEFSELGVNNKENPLTVYEMVRFSDDKDRLLKKIEWINENPYDSFIAYTQDFAGLSESGEKGFHHILDDFSEFLNIKDIFIQNPTKVIEENIKLMVDAGEKEDYDLSIIRHDYDNITEHDLAYIFQHYSKHIIGQDGVESELLTAFYTLYKERNNNKPLVLMFYGPSGVGKTESANFLSRELSGKEVFRTQVSMFQNQKSIDYLFGETHNAKSFAQDLLDRESNVILLDEFDKTFDTVYSAFYQMFDEGVFKDKNYQVDLKNTVIICTSNYRDPDSIRMAIGDPLFFRFNKLIEFQSLDEASLLKIIDLIYFKIFKKLDDDEKEIISAIGLLDYIKSRVHLFSEYDSPNYRQIENIIEGLINTELVNDLIMKTKEQTIK